MRKIIAALLLALTVAGCSSAAPSGTPSTSGAPGGVTTRQFTGSTRQRELLLRPRGTLTGLVVFMHGLANDRTQLLTDEQLFPARDALLSAGYAIVASDAHGDNVGNPASVADQLAAARDARARLGRIPHVDVLSFSMGGLDALLVAASHRLPGLHALALLSPVTDQRAFLTGSFADTIVRAFGDPPESQVPADVRRSDPAAQPVADYRGYRYHFWHSPDDRTVPASQSSTMAGLLARAGIRAPVTPLTGGHGDLAALAPATVVHLFATSTPGSTP